MNELQLFNYGLQEVRTIVKDNEVWFVGKDVCEVLEISNVGNALARLDEDEKTSIRLTDVSMGTPYVSIINEAGLYTLILGSRKPEAKAFKRWITHEVIPSIRKYGAYMTDDVLEQSINNSDYLISLLTSLEDEKQRRVEIETQNKIMQQRIAEYEPKVSYFDKILSSENTLTITQIAKDYGLSAIELNKILAKEKVQYKVNGQWVLYKEYQDTGYTKSETVPKGKTGDTIVQTKWTQKGRQFIEEVLGKNNIQLAIDLIQK